MAKLNLKLTREDVEEALKKIDKEGVPSGKGIRKYVLVSEDGKEYPVKYVVEVANNSKDGVNIILPKDFGSYDAMKCLESLGFSTKENKFELSITAKSINSTDKRFTLDDLNLGNNYKPLDACFKTANGDEIKRAYSKNEKRNSNQTLPRIACQVFEKELAALPDKDKENFPICKYKPNSDVITGIYASVSDFRKHRKTIEYLTYNCDNGHQFVIYCWNIFSTILFVQECLKRFGKPGDKFILTYCEKDEKEIAETEKNEAVVQKEQQSKVYQNQFSSMLIESKNLIFRGAPGTGKSYLAKEIATDIISDGGFCDYTLLNDEQKKQVEFVQFHPSYDYSDFVEGLRPKINDDGTMGFELQDGIFKKFVARARKNFEDSQKSREIIEKEVTAQESMAEFFSDVEFGVDTFKTINGNEFTITDVDDRHIHISIPGNASVNKLALNLNEVQKMLESEQKFEKIKDITSFFGKTFTQQGYSYDFAIYGAIKKKIATVSKEKAKQEKLKKYIFIIDEINRGEISKIFGELFFAIDPGYRGKAGEISTQYSNLHSDPGEKFYIPENVYIIGTMNDIDRSVDSFDFAMRRRFRFVEIKAGEHQKMLDSLENEYLENEAIKRMNALNKAIAEVEGLNENYQIGASYFLKLNTLGFDQLWTDYLQPLLQEYIRGMYDEEGIMHRFEEAYGYKPARGDANETAQDQG